ncbi:MAG: 3-dehydroquinate synthase [Spirochaetes bacterium GWF1_51_8]|nr:MAG: 3-dehydroquinate synthase [Spirochaetes bacterium GWF1_51_8]
MSVSVSVRLSRTIDESYEIRIGHGIFTEEARNAIERLQPSKIAVITDSHLNKLYSAAFKVTFGSGARIIEYRAGESRKTIATVLRLFAELQDAGLDRKSLVFAVGGGVTGDMAGFLAGIYLRGIPFVQVPTSLLAMADSSVGGKTGIDTPAGKNLMGVFNQPKAVIIDTGFLGTLPKKEFINGMAEVIKHGAITDADFFRKIAAARKAITGLDRETLIWMLEKSCTIKAGVVSADEKETGLRQTLNFGHTIGHAIEAVSKFGIPHGYAVAMGMAAEGNIAAERGTLPLADLNLLTKTLKGFGLLKYTSKIKKLDTGKVIVSAGYDKKNVAGKIKAVMLNGIGAVLEKDGKYSFEISENELLGGLRYLAEI